VGVRVGVAVVVAVAVGVEVVVVAVAVAVGPVAPAVTWTGWLHWLELPTRPGCAGSSRVLPATTVTPPPGSGPSY
jgi:hypothetical protein